MINFEILAASGEILVWDNQYELHWSSFAPDPRYLTINQNVGGTVSSDKLSGYDDDEVTLSNTVSSDYIFDNYSITGAVLTGDKFRFSGSDVTAEGEFTYIPTRYLTINPSVGGTVSANKVTGHDGDTITLSNTPSGDYNFSQYNITGGILTSNQFKFDGSDVIVEGEFTYVPYQTVFSDTGVYYSLPLQDRTYISANAQFSGKKYGVVSFNHSGKDYPTQNGLDVGLRPGDQWTLFNYSSNSHYKPVRSYTYLEERPNSASWFTPANNNVVSSMLISQYTQSVTMWYNDTRIVNNNNKRFKLIVDTTIPAASAYWNNVYAGSGTLTGTIDKCNHFTLYHNETAGDKFRISDIKVYTTNSFDVATSLS